MRNLKFYGASDDLFEIEGTFGGSGEADEVNVCRDGRGMVEVRTNDGTAMRVTAAYCFCRESGAAWNIGVEQVDEGVPIPDWPMRWSTHERGYSVLLEMDAPGDAYVSQVWPQRDDDS